MPFPCCVPVPLLSPSVAHVRSDNLLKLHSEGPRGGALLWAHTRSTQMPPLFGAGGTEVPTHPLAAPSAPVASKATSPLPCHGGGGTLPWQWDSAGTRGGFGGQLQVVSPLLLGDFSSWDARALPEHPPAFTSLRGCDSPGLTRVLEAAAVTQPRCPQHPAVPPAPTPISGAGAARSALIPAQRRFVRTGCIFILLLPPVSC